MRLREIGSCLFSKTLWNYIDVVPINHYGITSAVHRIAAGHLKVLNIFFLQLAPTHILIGAPVPSFSSWNSVSLGPEVHPETAI